MENIGGYRLIRLLGQGRRARVWLGHRPGEPAVAVKIFRPEAPAASIDVEVEALGRASSPHLLRLEDVASTAGGRPSLVLGRVQISLARVMATTALDPGSVVTVLAPLAEAVEELHRVGVAHGRISPATVYLDGTGCPVLARFGECELIGEFPGPTEQSLTPAQRATTPSLIGDLHRLVALARMLVPVSGSGAAVHEWLATVDPADQAGTFATELALRLYEFAEPLPVPLGAPIRLPVPDLPSRVVSEDSGMPGDGFEPDPAIGSPSEPAGDECAEPLPGSLRNVPTGFHELLASVLRTGPTAWLRERVVEPLRGVRKSVWLLTGGVALALVTAAAMLPSDDGVDALPGSEPAAEEHAASPPASPELLLSTDAEEAAFTLLLRRLQCYAANDPACLVTVLQRTDSVHDSFDSGPVPAGEPVSVETVEALGDTVLLSYATDRAERGMLLLIRTEDGWRIRELWPSAGAIADE